MPGPSPNIPYSGTQTVTPDILTRPRYIDSRASPEDFGANVGQALKRTGTQVGGQLADVAIQRQGMMNETMATNAETSYITQLGAITGKYQSLEGLAAVGATDDTRAQISALRQKTLATLPNPQSQRAFNMLAQRHEANALSDISRYSAAQYKAADNQSASAAMTTAIGQAGSLNVASDDIRFGHVLQDADFQLQRILNNQGYGPDGNTGMKQDARTGELSFDASTNEGQMAAAKYREMRDQAHGQAWELRLKTLADSNLLSAYQTYQQNRDKVPGATQAKMDAFFTPKVRDAQARDTADGALSQAATGYTGRPGGTPPETGAPSLDNNVGNIRVSPAAWEGKGAPQNGFETFGTPEQGVAAAVKNLRSYGDVTLGQAIAKWAPKSDKNDPEAYTARIEKETGLDGDLPIPFDDHAKMAALIKSMNGVEKGGVKFGDDVFRNGVQMASGTAPVPPPGATPQLAPQGTRPLYQTQADYFGAHLDEIVQGVRRQAGIDHPDDPAYADRAASHVEQRVNNMLTQQRLQYDADNRTLIQAFNGDFTKGARPTSVEQMLATKPGVKDAWDRLQISNPIAAEHIQNQILTANAKANKGEADFDAPGHDGTFRQLLDKVWSTDAGDPNRITEPSQIYGFRSALTQKGFDKLREELDATPAHTEIAKLKKDALAAAERAIVNPIPGTYGPMSEDPAARRAFDSGFQPAFFEAYNAALNDPKNPKTPWQLLGAGPDNLVDKLLPKFMPDAATAAAAAVNAKPVENRNIFERNLPLSMGGRQPPGDRTNPLTLTPGDPASIAAIRAAPKGTYVMTPDGLMVK